MEKIKASPKRPPRTKARTGAVRRVNDAIRNLMHASCFLGPSFLGVLLFFIVPFGVVVYYSFIQGPMDSSFVGLQNYENVMANSAFQLAVWELLRAIPYGQTTTYGALARRLAARQGLDRMSAQAVGGAVGRNPVSILVPCHRVVGADGSLTGYAGGLDRKRALLRLEGAALTFPAQ